MSYGGKGSAPRPIQNIQQYSENWDAIFKKKIQSKPSRQIRPTSKKSCVAMDENEIRNKLHTKP